MTDEKIINVIEATKETIKNCKYEGLIVYVPSIHCWQRKLYLRGLERSDLEGDYFQWLNDRESYKIYDSGIFPNTQEKHGRILQKFCFKQQ